MLLAVDTNFLIHLAGGREVALDALEIMRERVEAGALVAGRTVLGELDNIEENGSLLERKLAGEAIGKMRAWQITPQDLSSVGETVVRRIAAGLLETGLLPAEERNDALILAEAAFSGCGMLITSDTHLLEIDVQCLRVLLQEHGVGVPLIIAPVKIKRLFGGRR